MPVPAATYRLQFGPHFRFADAEALVPYLAALGITHAYASPLLQARPGSTHGYDVTDPTRWNEDWGGAAGFERWVRALRAHDLGLVLDIVPNHMAAHHENPWWRDVLAHGPASAHARTFDIEWDAGPPELAGRVVLPVLGGPLPDELAAGRMQLEWEPGSGLLVAYGERRFPLDPASYALVLDAAPGEAGPPPPPLAELARAFAAIPPRDDRSRAAQRRARAEACGSRFRAALEGSPAARRWLQARLRALAPRRDAPHVLAWWENLLGRQAYRLEFWRTGLRRINVRRFFDVTDLVGVRVEDPEVFARRHALELRAVAAGAVQGLRVDHVDGLWDPLEYLTRLQTHRTGEPKERPGADPRPYLVVEKILAEGERCPAEWPVAGTTGYDFLNDVTRLLVDPRGLRALRSAYRRFTGRRHRFEEVALASKRQVIEELFPADFDALARRLAQLAARWLAPRAGSADRTAAAEPDPARWRRAIAELTAHLPVYRTYVRDRRPAARDRRGIERAWLAARRQLRGRDRAALDACARVLLLDVPEPAAADALAFTMQWQQRTGAVMAKGVEDTALYRYAPLAALNEVGGHPDARPLGAREFVQRLRSRRATVPDTMNATSTHDTKRSEDVRARLCVLAEMAGAWRRRIERWHRWNAPLRALVRGVPVPDPATEWLLYQTLAGVWPLEPEEEAGLLPRLRAYVVKAAREAKERTHWLDPDPEVEAALVAFVERIVDPASGHPFRADFLEFQARVAFYGAVLSLAQALLKVAAPGVPDVYQGTELWYLRLVDPDNRARVDFPRRQRALGELLERAGGQPERVGHERRGGAEPATEERLAELRAAWRDGRIKLYVTARALQFRRAHAELFRRGEVIPVRPLARHRPPVCAFARRHGTEWACAIVPIRVARLCAPERFPLGAQAWGDAALRVPRGAPRRWHNVLTGETLEAETAGRRPVLPLARVFSSLPVALLHGAGPDGAFGPFPLAGWEVPRGPSSL